MNQATQQSTPRRRALIIAGIALALIAGAILVLAVTDDPPPSTSPPSGSPSPSPSPSVSTSPSGLTARLQEAVTVDGVTRHLEEFQRIADENGGNRYTATPGHEESAAYVARVLRNAGYEVSFDRFDVTVYEENAPSVLQRRAPSRTFFENSADFTTFNFSPSGSVTGRLTSVGVTPETDGLGGCEESAFSGFPSGDIALVQAGPCTLTDQVLNAQDAGASAALVMFTPELADTSAGVLRPTLASSEVTVPALAVSTKLGVELARSGTRVHLEVAGEIAERSTRNVIAEQSGETDDVVMVGAHLDSVPDGPGINDNGSGSASILELAVALSGVETREGVRFAFWSAEELGLIGSDHYVSELSDAERNRITAYLNFDMVASPNYMRLVYGDSLGNVDDPAAIKNLFLDYFAERDLDTDLIDLSGRSDHGPFERAGIPVGGLFTGAEMIKDREAARLFGGEPGRPGDPCYHLACDDIENISEESLDQLSDAIAFSVATLATSGEL
ncbi:MAG: M28 family peptidase [Actinobacteria bacterium]|nr:M28 family peptidase [Actinomycetota bacterium]